MNTYVVTNTGDYNPATERPIKGTLRYYLTLVTDPRKIIITVPEITLKANLDIVSPYFHILGGQRCRIKHVSNTQIAVFTHHWIVQNINFVAGVSNKNALLCIGSGCTDGLVRNCHADWNDVPNSGDGEAWASFTSPNRIRFEYCSAKGDHAFTLDTGNNISLYRCLIKNCVIRTPLYRGPGLCHIEECDITVNKSGVELFFDTVAQMNVINNIFRGTAAFDYYPARVNVSYTGLETNRIYKSGNLWFPTPTTTAEFKFGVAGQTGGQAIPDTVYSDSPFTLSLPNLDGVPV